ncbi:MAG: GNAT family N-acetyltransferase [Hyphomicrobiaceae bacterium]
MKCGDDRPAKVHDADIAWRDFITEADETRVRDLVAATGFFTPEEIEIAAELVRERLAKGAPSGYEFVMAELAGRLAGYACYGLIPGSDVSHDLYWIAVQPELHGRGIGNLLMRRVEAAVRQAGGDKLYADTSSTEKYDATRAFYISQGFREAAMLADFYRDGDGKVIFEKRL